MTTPIKHESNKDVFRGHLHLFLNGKPFAFEKNAELSLTADAQDTSNKMCGDWGSSLPGKKGFSLSAESLVTRKEGALSYDTLLDIYINGGVIDFVFGGAKVTDQTNDGGKFEVDTSQKRYEGQVWINSLNLGSTHGENVSCSANFTGTGALKPVDSGTPVSEVSSK